jgi:hypothetical protein
LRPIASCATRPSDQAVRDALAALCPDPVSLEQRLNRLFAAQQTSYYDQTESELWCQMSQAGRQFLSKNYLPERVTEEFAAFLHHFSINSNSS